MTETTNIDCVTTNFFYDANGNQIKKEVQTQGGDIWYYTYDFENRLIEVKKNGLTIQRNWYDGDGKRIKKVEASQTTIYIYLGWNIIYEKEFSTMTETKYIFKADCGCHVGKVVGGTTYFLHVDHLGSVRQETDVSGNAVWASPAMYDPFGELRGGGPANNEEGHLYTGKLRDSSTGLYYYGARYYDAKIGRLITKDTFAGQKIDPQTQNLYVYVTNNPINATDPTGNTPEKEGKEGKNNAKSGSASIAADPTNGGRTGGYPDPSKSDKWNLGHRGGYIMPATGAWRQQLIRQNPDGSFAIESDGSSPSETNAYRLANKAFEEAKEDPKNGLTESDRAEFVDGFIEGLKDGYADLTGYEGRSYDNIYSGRGLGYLDDFSKFINSIAAKLFAGLAQDCCVALLANPHTSWLYVPCVIGFMII